MNNCEGRLFFLEVNSEIDSNNSYFPQDFHSEEMYSNDFFEENSYSPSSSNFFSSTSLEFSDYEFREEKETKCSEFLTNDDDDFSDTLSKSYSFIPITKRIKKAKSAPSSPKNSKLSSQNSFTPRTSIFSNICQFSNEMDGFDNKPEPLSSKPFSYSHSFNSNSNDQTSSLYTSPMNCKSERHSPKKTLKPKFQKLHEKALLNIRVDSFSEAIGISRSESLNEQFNRSSDLNSLISFI